MKLVIALLVLTLPLFGQAFQDFPSWVTTGTSTSGGPTIDIEVSHNVYFGGLILWPSGTTGYDLLWNTIPQEATVMVEKVGAIYYARLYTWYGGVMRYEGSWALS